MPRVARSALLACSPGEMFALVDDVERYPEFVPWCSGAQVLARGEDEVVASLTLRRGTLSASFTTRNLLDAPHAIDMNLVEGPLTRLAGGWRFEDIGAGQGCRVSLDLEFEAAGMMAHPIARLLEGVAGAMVGAFCARAEALHG